jgi:spore maturation protein CgeB
VFACGPNNEIDVSDGTNFYDKVSDIIGQHSIDLLWDIEGGGVPMDFLFKRFPDNITIPKAYWAIDTHQYLSFQVEKAKHFDFVFSAQKNAVDALGLHASWLPAGASLHEKDYRVERDIDVGFIGNVEGAHAYRKIVLDFVKDNVPRFMRFSSVFLEPKAELTSRMKIGLNVSLNNDVNFRVFETLACGTFLLTDRIYNNGMEELFEDGTHLVTFINEQDLLEKINYYLTHNEERIRIAEAGKNKVLENYTHKSIIAKALGKIYAD